LSIPKVSSKPNGRSEEGAPMAAKKKATKKTAAKKKTTIKKKTAKK
jgi:hypothetical protein